MSSETAAEPNAMSAVERAVEAAQRIAVERLELTKLEMMEGAGRVTKGGGLLLAGGSIVILGLTGLAVALVVVLAAHLPLAASIAIVAGAHVLAGVVLAAVGAGIAGRKAT